MVVFFASYHSPHMHMYCNDARATSFQDGPGSQHGDGTPRARSDGPPQPALDPLLAHFSAMGMAQVWPLVRQSCCALGVLHTAYQRPMIIVRAPFCVFMGIQVCTKVLCLP